MGADKASVLRVDFGSSVCFSMDLDHLITNMGFLTTHDTELKVELMGNNKPAVIQFLFSAKKDPADVTELKEDVTEEDENVVESTDDDIEAAKEEATRVIRSHMLQILEAHICSRCTSEAVVNKVPSMALLLERMLYEKAPNLETYCDLASLEDRIDVVTEEKDRHAIFKAATKPTKPKGGRSRDDVLKEVLKGPRYEMARKLIREIKIHKVRRGASMNCAGARHEYNRPTTTIMMAGEDEAFTARQSLLLPQPLYTLFFDTPLVIIFETFGARRLKEQNWNALLEQAIHNLRAYKSYIKSTGAP